MSRSVLMQLLRVITKIFIIFKKHKYLPVFERVPNNNNNFKLVVCLHSHMVKGI